MVLLRFLPEKWMESKAEYAFIIGWSYSIISILIAALIFPKDPSVVAIAFTTILILSDLKKIYEEKEEYLKEKISLISFFSKNKDLLKIYVFLSFGIFLVYSTAAIILPSFQVNKLFESQLAVRGIYGNAIAFSTKILTAILLNNLIVLFVCLFISFFTDDGGIFMITWNLSVWGTIFGVTARNAAFAMGTSPIILFIIIIMIVLPHVILEILSYIFGSISGSFMGKYARTKKSKNLIKYGLISLTLAVIFLIFGAIIETFVLNNSGLYREIIALSYA